MEQPGTGEAAAEPPAGAAASAATTAATNGAAAAAATVEPSVGTPPASAGEPGIGAIAALAFAVVMVPGILLYVVLRAVGLAIGPAGLLGLLMMFGCVFAYPVLLRRLGWVGRR